MSAGPPHGSETAPNLGREILREASGVLPGQAIPEDKRISDATVLIDEISDFLAGVAEAEVDANDTVEAIYTPDIMARPANGNEAVEQAVEVRLAGLRMGRIAVGSELDQGTVKESPKPTSMLSMLQDTLEGNQEAPKGALANIKTLLTEATAKYGNVIEVDGHMDEQGRLWQYGQSSDEFLLNTFQNEGVNSLTCAEARDILRFEELVRQGLILPGESYTVASKVPKGRSREELHDRGYFLESMSVVVRKIKLLDDGKIKIRSSFVAGVDMEQLSDELGDGLGEEEIIARQERALEIRHDDEMVRQFYQQELGLELNDADAETVLGHGFILPADIDDMVVEERLDEIAGQLLGKRRFLGTDKQGDYRTIVEECRVHASRLDAMAEDILRDAVAEVDKGLITEVGEIPKRLREFAKAKLVDRVIYEIQDIDLRIFGSQAPTEIILAQAAFVAGNLLAVETIKARAIEKSSLSDCPNGMDKKKAELDGPDDGIPDALPEGSREEDDDTEDEEDEDEHGSLKFKCPNGHTNTRPRHILIPKCQKSGCKAKVSCKKGADDE
jgi:hypothetical protein